MLTIKEINKIVRSKEPLLYENFFERFRLNLRYHFAERLNVPIAKPHWVYISLTNNCNYKCHMCGVIKQDQTTKLSTPKIKSLIDEVASWRSDQIITFTGGEVFLRPDFLDIAEYSVSKGVKTEVITNASLINDIKARRIVRSGLKSVNISLDGTKPEIHNQIRNRPNAFQLTVAGIKQLVKAKKKNGGVGPQISVWTTIQNWNVHNLSDITLFAKELGAEVHILHPVIINQCDMQQTDNSTKSPLWVPPEKWDVLEEQVGKLIEYERKNGFIAFIHDPKLFVTYFKGQHSRKAWKCNPFQFLNIGPDGKTQICGDSFGNVKETTIEESYHSERAAEQRDLMKKCRINCLQTCWARPESDNLNLIIKDFLDELNSKTRLSKKEKNVLLNMAVEELERYELLTKKLSSGFEKKDRIQEKKLVVLN